jgi:hypothetical protein
MLESTIIGLGVKFKLFCVSAIVWLLTTNWMMKQTKNKVCSYFTSFMFTFVWICLMDLFIIISVCTFVDGDEALLRGIGSIPKLFADLDRDVENGATEKLKLPTIKRLARLL